MPTCKDCLHVEVCELCYNSTDEEYVDVADKCKHFKDKSKFVDLPCKVGDTIYLVKMVCTENCPKKYKKDGSIRFCYGKEDCVKWGIAKHHFNLVHVDFIGKSYFLTKEEAEKALAERGKKE